MTNPDADFVLIGPIIEIENLTLIPKGPADAQTAQSHNQIL